jgi:tryptophan-rich sensory protein
MIDVGILFLSIFIYVIVVFPGFLTYTGTSEETAKYALQTLGFKIPSAVFIIVWTIMYGLISAAGIIHLNTLSSVTEIVTDPFVAIVAIFIVNVSLLHFWMPLYFRMHMPVAALIDIILLVLTAITETVLYGYYEYYISMAFFIGYSIWLIVAMIFNSIAVYRCSTREELTRCKHDKK